ncbi:hypothetical protein FB107DRAFT_206699, partial [Schizophyllum commune]
PDPATMFNNSAARYNGYIGDGVYIEDSLPPPDTKSSVSDNPWSQPARKFEPCWDVFDPSFALQKNGGYRLGCAQQYLQPAPAHPVSATGELDDIFLSGHDQHIARTIRPEHLQYNSALARAPGNASSSADNIPFRLEALLPQASSETVSIASWNPQHAALDAPYVDMYYELLQAPQYGEHSTARPTQQAIELARQPEPGVCFGDTFDQPADVTVASVSSEDPFAHTTRCMPFEAESSFNEFSTQSPPSRLPYSHSVPTASSPFGTRYDSPMNSLDFGAPQNMSEAAMPQAVRRPLEASILNTSVTSDGQTSPAVACSSTLGGPGRAPIVAPPSRLDATHK